MYAGIGSLVCASRCAVCDGVRRRLCTDQAAEEASEEGSRDGDPSERRDHRPEAGVGTRTP